MKKLRLQSLILLLVVFPLVHIHAQWNKKEALRVMNRFTDRKLPVKLSDLPKNDGKDQYEITVDKGQVR
ncbi:MAG: hypothetical protein ACRC77_04190, partial [Bacteroidales bacterium]